MYPVGHILTASIYSKVAAKKLALNFVPVFSISILSNLIDVDHFIYYFKDDGTANSLVLHPGHLYIGVPIFALIVLGFFKPESLNLIYMLIGAFAMHMAADALAFLCQYNLIALIIIDVVLFLILVLIRNKFDASVPFSNLFLFLLCVTLVSASVQYWMHFILKYDPQKELIVYVVPNLIFLLSGLSFYFVFNKKESL
ncbi:MAG: hypothetical protein PSX36_10650 [bacterium]|nr:hypothetical protein [bacterium]